MDRPIILNCLSIETAHFMDRQQLTHMLSMKLSEFMDRGVFYIGEMGCRQRSWRIRQASCSKKAARARPEGSLRILHAFRDSRSRSGSGMMMLLKVWVLWVTPLPQRPGLLCLCGRKEGIRRARPGSILRQLNLL